MEAVVVWGTGRVSGFDLWAQRKDDLADDYSAASLGADCDVVFPVSDRRVSETVLSHENAKISEARAEPIGTGESSTFRDLSRGQEPLWSGHIIVENRTQLVLQWVVGHA